MFSEVDFTKLGGLFVYQNTLAFLQTAYGSSLDAVAKGIGEKYVMYGCVDDGVNLSDGFIVCNGILMPFIGGLKTDTIYIETITGDEGFDDGNIKEVYKTYRAKFGAPGSGFPYTDLKRLPFNSSSIGDFATIAGQILKAAVGQENEVILKGCLVTDVVPGGPGTGTLEISAGLVLMGDKCINTPAYSGAYPCYLKDNASWVTAVPGAGSYITFDPYTSQRYADVMKRATTSIGDIVIKRTLSDRFDTGTGLGRWEMKGFKLSSTLQNRVPVGLWWDGIVEVNVSHANNTGPENQGGENAHTLQSAEQGSLTVATKTDDIGGGTYNAVAKIRINGVENIDGPSNQVGFGTNITVPAAAALQAHENRQPFTVVVYAERI
jgi:hypothetical protein